MKKTTPLLVFMILAGLIIPDTAYTKDSHDHHDHDESGIEIGLSIGYVHLEEEGEHHEEEGHHEEDGHSDDALGVHLHIGKRLADDGILSHVSLGIGSEVIFADEEHYGLNAFTSIHPWRGLVLSIGPAVEWSKHEGQWESHYSTHMEAAYVFDMDEFHLGPIVGYSKSNHGEHYTVGVHLGYHL